jgi:putative peptide zinc metalloprotease protein
MGLPQLHPDVRMQLFDGSGAICETYLVRNPHGQYWTIPEPYYRFFVRFDGTRTLEVLQAELDSGNYGPLTGCSAAAVIEEFLRPKGLLAEESAAMAPPSIAVPALRATFVFPLFSSERLSPLTRITQGLFRPSVVFLVMALGSMLLLDTYYKLQAFFIEIGDTHALTWRMIGLILLSLPLHELGHVSACRRYNISAGKIGAGLYICLPVMYADLSAIWGLPRKHRLVVNLGGIYFDFIGACILAAAAAITRNADYAIVAFLYLASCLFNLTPFVKLDGYWCLSDLIGIPNLIHNSFKAWREWLSGQRTMPWTRWQRSVLIIFSAACVFIWAITMWAIWQLLVSAYKALWVLTTIGICPRRLWWQFSPTDLQNILLVGFVAVFLLSFVLNLIRFLLNRRRASTPWARQKESLNQPQVNLTN